ncbi:hypothetical protein GCM10009850_072430 [Nonomuraea monospora]|uniref:Anti-sigma factor antagonist n=1 Tax=Nonomuraea monospora TaxID=568818 RepID=A0ABN3CQS4_9ACTN
MHLAHRHGGSLEPATSSLTLGCHRLDGGVLISVIGEVDATNADRLETYVRLRLLPGLPVVLDLGLLTFMDSHGVRVLERLHTVQRERGGALHLAGVQGVVARLLRITGAWTRLNIHPGTAEAILDVLDHHPAASLPHEPAAS